MPVATSTIARQLSAVVLVALFAAAATAQVVTRAELDALVQPAVDANWCHAIVVGVIDGDQRLVAGYGQLAADDPRAPDGDTLFEIGSVSKLFTGILLAEAVVRGEVALDDPISTRLPADIAFGITERPATLHDLATHQAGFARMPGDFLFDDLASEWATYDETRLFALLDGARPQNPPGSYAYSNLGVGLLGNLLGRAADSDYETLLHERITAPLGMASTVVSLPETLLPRIAAPHDADLSPSARWEMRALAGCGGIRSSVNDMLEFAAWVAGVGPSPKSETLDESLARSLRPTREAWEGMRLGLGWHMTQSEGVWWHNGSTEGYRAMLEVLPDEGRAVLVLSNDAGPVAEEIADSIMGRLLGMELRPLDVPTGPRSTAEALDVFTGRYAHALAGVLELRVEAGVLVGQLAGQPAFRLWPDGPRRFRYRSVQAVIEFGNDTADDQPEINELRLLQNGAKLVFAREPLSTPSDP